MKKEAPKRKISYQDVITKATEAFGYDKDKALRWYVTKRLEYQNKSPFDLCKEGKAAAMIKVLEKVIRT